MEDISVVLAAVFRYAHLRSVRWAEPAYLQSGMVHQVSMGGDFSRNDEVVHPGRVRIGHAHRRWLGWPNAGNSRCCVAPDVRPGGVSSGSVVAQTSVELCELQCVLLTRVDSLVVSRFHRSRDQPEHQRGESDKHTDGERHHFYSLSRSVRWRQARADEHSKAGAGAKQYHDQ